MRRFSISRYRLGEDDYVQMPKELLQAVVDNDPDLYWYEDVDEYYRERQKQRKTPAIRVSFVYNYERPPAVPDFNAVFLEGTDDVLVKVHNPSKQVINKLREIAEKLEANLYET